jgi:diguanylate cyclase (GGDEF)-like protein
VAFLSHHDVLTGLSNRALFVDRVGQHLQARVGGSSLAALAIINLQRFRNINETFGRHGGDYLLVLVARQLEKMLRGGDRLARVGPDTFAIVLHAMRDAADVVRSIEDQVLDCFKEPFSIGGEQVRVTARLGVAIFPLDGQDAETLFKNAEAALKKARETGEQYLFYAAEMNARAAQALALETRLRNAVELQQFLLHYQPKVSLQTGKIEGVEALIRWNDPDKGLIPPNQFIPLLEETGLIVEVGRWAVLQAMRQFGQWSATGIEAPRIAVNVSPVQIRQRNFIEVIRSATDQSTEGDHGLDLEITESLLMEDVKGNIVKLQAIKEMGVNIAIDDFGTGYSSLSYLARLPVDSLKIDRSFITEMVADPDSMAIVTTIISLAHSLQRKVIAEGVESEGQSRLLKLLRCEEMQGYLFSKPLPADELLALLRKHSA